MLSILGLLGMAFGATAWLPLRGRDDEGGGNGDDPDVIEVDHDDSGMYGPGEPTAEDSSAAVEDDLAAGEAEIDSDEAEAGAEEPIEVVHDDSGMYGPAEPPPEVPPEVVEDEDDLGGVAGARLDAADEVGTDGGEASGNEDDLIEVVHDDSGLYGPDELSDGSAEAEGPDEEASLDGAPGLDLLALALGTGAEGVATVEAFDAAEDALVVLYDGAGEPPELACVVDADGATLLADGDPVARFPDAATIDLDAVRLVGI